MHALPRRRVTIRHPNDQGTEVVDGLMRVHYSDTKAAISDGRQTVAEMDLATVEDLGDTVVLTGADGTVWEASEDCGCGH